MERALRSLFVGTQLSEQFISGVLLNIKGENYGYERNFSERV